MIKSDYIKDILDLTFEGEKYADLLLGQIEHLVLKETKYTGIGCYYNFEYSEEIEKYRLSEIQLLDLFGEHNHMIENIVVINEDANVHAYPMIWFTNGLIDCIEIWNGHGDYPDGELLTYELKRL